MGAQLADIWFITRTWTGKRIGEGQFTDAITKVFPLPQIKDFSHDIRITAGGAVQQGDLILVGLSRNQYPNMTVLRTDTGIANIEKMIKVGDHFYRVIHIKEKLVTWDIHVRKILQDETETHG